MTVLLLGGTGQVGSLVLEGLLDRDATVRAIVRSPGKIDPALRESPDLEIVEGSYLEIAVEDLEPHFRDIDAVVSCLGKGGRKALSGEPNLLLRSLQQTCEVVHRLEPAVPVRLTFLASAGIDDPSGADAGRGLLPRLSNRFSRLALSHIRDYHRALGFLRESVGTEDPFVEWSVVRPTFFQEGPRSQYVVRESGVGFLSEKSTVRNIAHFTCELVQDDGLWEQWAFSMPAIFDAS